jgi:hypothetical protein
MHEPLATLTVSNIDLLEPKSYHWTTQYDPALTRAAPRRRVAERHAWPDPDQSGIIVATVWGGDACWVSTRSAVRRAKQRGLELTIHGGSEAVASERD